VSLQCSVGPPERTLRCDATRGHAALPTTSQAAHHGSCRRVKPASPALMALQPRTPEQGWYEEGPPAWLSDPSSARGLEADVPQQS